MIELVLQRFEFCLEVGEVDQPAGVRIHRALHHNLHHKGMAVQSCALVARRHMRQQMSRLKTKFLGEFHRERLGSLFHAFILDFI